MSNLVSMINSGELTFEDFLKMHPFSASSMSVYTPALEGIEYFSELYIKSVDLYEHLAEVSNVILRNNKNLVVITGYRGCGKTNLLRYIEYLANGAEIDQSLREIHEYELSCESNDDARRNLQKQYNDAKEKIYQKLNGAVDDVEGEELQKYIANIIRSTPVYINFDIGGLNRHRPLSVKLYTYIEPKIRNAILENRMSKVVDFIDDFVQRNQNSIIENFKEKGVKDLETFWTNAKIIFSSSKQDIRNLKKLLREMQELPLEYLLFCYFMLEMSWIIVMKSESRKYLYLLDNIDMLSDKEGKVFRGTIYGIFKYVYNSYNLFAGIKKNSKNEQDRSICNIYQNINIIIAMRETSAMQVTGHNRKIVAQNISNFDISEDTDKSLILDRRVQLAKKLIDSGKISNKLFKRAVHNLDSILQDRVLMQRLFMLNNEDVRTSDQLLSSLCLNDFLSMDREASQANTNGYIFGKRGIVYKEIFKKFDNENYLRDLQIIHHSDVRSMDVYPYSNVRILLTLLYKQREKQHDRIIFNDAEYVDLKTLYGEVEGVIGLEEFSDILDRMYSLRDADYWNHLVTFDNIAAYSKESISNYIAKNNVEDDKKVYVSITSAGKMFLDQMCVHFEYFSQRFCNSTYKGLFNYDCFGNENDAATVKSIINSVYSAVVKCTKSLEGYNHAVMKKTNRKHYSGIINTIYYYESQFHEERIILNHISYLDAYRTYMLSKSALNAVMNTFLVKSIKNYLNLLYTDDSSKTYRDPFYSPSSKNSFNKLMVCVEQIEKNSDEGKLIEINSFCYDRYFKNMKCDLFRKKGW